MTQFLCTYDIFLHCQFKFLLYKIFFLPVLVPPSVKPVVDFGPKSPLPKPTEGADVVAVAVEEPRVPKLSPPVELLENKTIRNNYFLKQEHSPPPLFQFLSHTIICFPEPHTAGQDTIQAHCHQTER